MIRPSQTKLSVQRQELALKKRFQSLNVVTDEVLYCIFKYITISDLLRCCCVSRTWMEIANAPVLWEIQFKRLPKQLRSLSSKAKTTGNVYWKDECLSCAKKRRNNFIKRLSKKKQKIPMNRLLGSRWVLVFVDTKSSSYEITAEEDFVFNIGISIRWNDVDIPPLSQMVSVKLYALTPLFFNEDMKPVKDGICTRALVTSHSFKDVSFGQLGKLTEDEHVSLYALGTYLYFGLWKSSIPKDGSIAFIGMCVPVHGLTNVICQSSETKERDVFLDDVSPSYGQDGYYAVMELRNCRKSFFYEVNKVFSNGFWLDDFLIIEHRRDKAYTFYDIKDKLHFTWKTTALKGSIVNFLILDLNLFDCNNNLMTSFSSPVNLIKVCKEQDNYSFDNAELWKIEKFNDNAKCLVEFVRNTDTDELAVLSIKIHLRKTFVNEWFGTSY